MEANNRKRMRGFVKSKLMPFYRSGSKPSSTSNLYVSSKVNPSQASLPAASVGYVVQAHHQDYLVSPPQKQKPSYIVPVDINNNNNINSNNNSYGDEHVDARAASYISAVQERFKLERINSERVKHENIHQKIS